MSNQKYNSYENLKLFSVAENLERISVAYFDFLVVTILKATSTKKKITEKWNAFVEN